MSPLVLPATRSAVMRTSPGATTDAPGDALAPGCAAKVAPGSGGCGPLKFVFGKSDSSGGVVALTAGGAVGVGIELAIASGVAVGLALALGLGLAAGLEFGAGALAASETNGNASSTQSAAAHVLPAPSAM